MHIPTDIPAVLYWSVTAYDTGTRSQIHNGTPFSRISTYTEPRVNDDGSIDLFFGPDVPAAEEANWIRTVPGQGWFFLFRLYGPQEAYFDRSWTSSRSRPHKRTAAVRAAYDDAGDSR